jgi:Reverse transcriptase (RNA-dependent DNA polymerase)
LNDNYAAISNDANYEPPSVKVTAKHNEQSSHITEWQIFQVLDALKLSAMELDKIPARFLKTGEPILAKPLSDVFNLSLSTSVVPHQWKTASILPILKSNLPLQPADYRPISITPILPRILERLVVKDFIYPSLWDPITGIRFNDQYAFQPTNRVITLLATHPSVTVYALDFSKAFYSVRHIAR